MNCHGLMMSCLFHHRARLHRLSVRLHEPLRKRTHGQYLSHELLFHLYSQFPVVSPDPWKRNPACWYCRYRFLMKACLSPCTKILRIPLNICFNYPRRSSFMSSEARSLPSNEFQEKFLVKCGFHLNWRTGCFMYGATHTLKNQASYSLSLLPWNS